MFAKPRPKKSILPPPSKKRKTTSAVEEVNFDLDARQEYLTGFHKRKQQRIKLAQEENAKRAHQEKLEMRKQARENRRREVEEHVQAVNQILRESRAAGGEVEESEEESAEEWDGIPDQPDLQIIDQEEEYIDEDRYTTVTVETVAVSKDGLFKPQVLDAEEEEEERSKKEAQDAAKQAAADAIRNRTEKKKKKKFRYESKIERQLTERKSKSKKAKARASRESTG